MLQNSDLAGCYAPQPSLPLMREVDLPQGKDGGRETKSSLKLLKIERKHHFSLPQSA
jgi:hypothetical protein